MKSKYEIDNRLIQAALVDFHTMNTDSQWARVQVSTHNVHMTYGPIHSNGFVEYRTGAYTYYIDRQDKVIRLTARLGG